MNDQPSQFIARAIICEDEPLAAKAIRDYLSNVEWIKLVGEARDGNEAVKLIWELEPDLLFLDVRMPGLTGLQVVDALAYSPAIVFTTAYDEYAVAAFDAGATDYLVKPFGRERFLKTLARVRSRIVGERSESDAPAVPGRARYATRLFARQRMNTVPLPVSQIHTIDAAPGGVYLVTAGGRYTLDVTLGKLHSRLNPRDFVRIHRAHIVNLGHVTSIQPYDERRLIVTMRDGNEIIASRGGSQVLRNLMM